MMNGRSETAAVREVFSGAGIFLMLLALLACGPVASAAEFAPSRQPEVIPLGPPDTRETTAPAEEETLPSHGDGVTRITNVTRPSITLYRADGGTSSGASPAGAPAPAVLVCPGGGYRILAINLEGHEVARWLNSIGITAAVLKYRVPENRAGAYEDAQEALELIRRKAPEWNIDPERVGILGFSAGAHLAARVSTPRDEEQAPDAGKSREKASRRPDFAVLVYPAYLGDKEYRPADDVAVTSQTCPTFLVQTQDDTNHVFSSLTYATELQKAGVPYELHLFPVGGHGYGLRPTRHAVSDWPRLCERWLKQRVQKQGQQTARTQRRRMTRGAPQKL